MSVRLPLSRPSISDAVEHRSGGKLGPMTNVGRTDTKSIPFALQNSHAAFSAKIFDKGYQILGADKLSVAFIGYHVHVYAKESKYELEKWTRLLA